MKIEDESKVPSEPKLKRDCKQALIRKWLLVDDDDDDETEDKIKVTREKVRGGTIGFISTSKRRKRLRFSLSD